jgi:hypothetical protein
MPPDLEDEDELADEPAEDVGPRDLWGPDEGEYIALIERAAQTTPTQAILDAWYRIAFEVAELKKAVEAVDPDLVRDITPAVIDAAQTLSELADAGVVPTRIVQAVEQLSELRDEVVHSDLGGKVSLEQAIDYVNIAFKTIAFLRHRRQLISS